MWATTILVCVLVAFYGQGRTEAYAVAFASAGAMLGLVSLHFWRRWQDVDRWNKAPKLWLDVAVLSPITPEQLYIVEDTPMVVSNLATDWAVCMATKNGRGKVLSAIKGCDITFTVEPWTHNGVLVGGIQDGEHITVVGPEFAGIERTRALIIHELSHLALTALGIPAGPMGENHHRIFAEEGLGV
jgi:hypothetical protein